MVWSVIDSFLNSFWTLHKIGMFYRPRTTVKLTINLYYLSFRMGLFNLLKDMIKIIVEFSDCIFGIIERFSEVISWIFAWNRYFLGEKISSSSVSGDFLFSEIMNGKVGSVYFFGSNPKNVRFVLSFLLDFIDELISGG